MILTDLLYYAVASFVGIVSAARVTRLFTQDVYPPVARLRAGWENLVARKGWDSEWAVLATCPYCAAFWVSAVIMGWAVLSVGLTGDIHAAWWLFNGLFAGAYLAAMVVVRDGE